jgi:hypothetical protein
MDTRRAAGPCKAAHQEAISALELTIVSLQTDLSIRLAGQAGLRVRSGPLNMHPAGTPPDGRGLARSIPRMGILPPLSLRSLSLRCLLGGHEPFLRQKRDDEGRAVKPHVLIWECGRCQQRLGETALGAKWNLLARIRRQRTPAQSSVTPAARVSARSATSTAATRSSVPVPGASLTRSAVPGHARR